MVINLDKKIYQSKRGKYKIDYTKKINILTPKAIDKIIKEYKLQNLYRLVESEFDIFYSIYKNKYGLKESKVYLKTHSFWTKENNNKLIESYILFYLDLFIAMENYNRNKESRNSITTNNSTCITSIQLNNNCLNCFQRSCDLSLGYLADMITLRLIAKKCKIKLIYWFIGCPHVYLNNEEKTISFFNHDIERPKFIFNIRKGGE